jgi:hypothetical protein
VAGKLLLLLLLWGSEAGLREFVVAAVVARNILAMTEDVAVEVAGMLRLL